MSLVANDATFEFDVGHWYAGPLSYLSWDTYSVAPRVGSAVLRLTWLNTTSQASPILGNGNSNDFYYVSPGDVVNVSAWTQSDIRNTLASYSVIVTLKAYTAASGFIDSWDSTTTPVYPGTWGQSTVSATMPSGAAFVTIQFGFYGPISDVAANDMFYISDVSADLQHVPQPVNNDFLNAIVISGDSGSVGGTTVGATYERIPYDDYLFAFIEQYPEDVWYEYTNEGRGQVDFSLVAAGYNAHEFVVYRQEPHGGPADITMLLNTGQHGTAGSDPIWDSAFFYNPGWRYFIRVGAGRFLGATFTLSWHFNPFDGTVETRGVSENVDVATRVYPANLVARLTTEGSSVLTSTAKPGSAAVGLGWIGQAPDVPMVGQAFRCDEWVESLATGTRHFWIGWTPTTGPFFYSFISEDGFFPNWNNEYEFPNGFGGLFTSQSTSALNGSLVTLYGMNQRMNQTPLRRFIWPFGDMEHGGTWHWNTGTTGMSIGVSSARSHSPSHSLEAIVGTTQLPGTVWAHADGSTAIYVEKNKQYVLRNWTSSFQTSYTGLSVLGTGLERLSSPLGETSSSSGYITSLGYPTYFTYNYNYITLQTSAWERYLRPYVNIQSDFYAPRPLTAGDRYYWDDMEISEFLYSSVREFRLTTKANDSYKTISGLSDEAYGSDAYHVDITYPYTPIKHLVAVDNQHFAGRYWFYTFDENWNLLNRKLVDGDYDGAPILLDNDGRSVVFEQAGINLRKYDVYDDTFSTVIASGAPGAVVGVASNGDYVFNNPGWEVVQFMREPRTGGGYNYVSGQINMNTQLTTPSRIIQQYDLGLDYTGDYEWFAVFGSTSIDAGGGHYNYVTCFYRRSIDSFDTSPMEPTFTLDHPYVDGTDPSAVNFFTSQSSPSSDIRYVYPVVSCPALFKP